MKKFKALTLMMTLPACLLHSLTTKDYWGLIISSCLSLYIPRLWVGLTAYLVFKTVLEYRNKNRADQEIVQSVIVNSVEKNELSKLVSILDENPNVLYLDYHRRSLEAWCRYYKNTKAQELVAEMMKKYPREMKRAA